MRKAVLPVLLILLALAPAWGKERATELSFGVAFGLDTQTEETRIGYERAKEVIIYSPSDFEFTYESRVLKLTTSYVAVNFLLPAGIYYYPSRRLGIGITYSLGAAFEYPLTQEQYLDGEFLGYTAYDYLLPQLAIINSLHIATKLGNALTGNLFLFEYGFTNKIKFTFSKDNPAHIRTTPSFGPSIFLGAEIRRKKRVINIGGSLRVLFEINKIDSYNYVEGFNVAAGPELRIRGTYFRRVSGSSEKIEPVKEE